MFTYNQLCTSQSSTVTFHHSNAIVAVSAHKLKTGARLRLESLQLKSPLITTRSASVMAKTLLTKLSSLLQDLITTALTSRVWSSLKTPMRTATSSSTRLTTRSVHTVTTGTDGDTKLVTSSATHQSSHTRAKVLTFTLSTTSTSFDMIKCINSRQLVQDSNSGPQTRRSTSFPTQTRLLLMNVTRETLM